MRFASKCAGVMAVFALVGGASAQVLEDFEHGDPSLYHKTLTRPGPISIVPEAARDGRFGARVGGEPLDDPFYYRTDVLTSPGGAYRAWVRMHGRDRAYFAIAKGHQGALAATIAPNTRELLLIDVADWRRYTDLASAPLVFTIGAWHQLELEWRVDDHMVVRLYDETGALRAETPPAATGHRGFGGIAFRSFRDGADFDTVHAVSLAPNVLILDGSSVRSTARAAAEHTAGVATRTVTTAAGFIAALREGPWPVALINEPSLEPDLDAIAADLEGYLAGGGRVIMNYWNLDANPMLQQIMGVQAATAIFDPMPVFATTRRHGSWGTLAAAAAGDDRWHENGDILQPVCESAEIIGVFGREFSRDSAIVLANEGRSIVNGFDWDSMDPEAGLALAAGQFRWILSHLPGPVGSGTGSCLADCDGSGQLDFFDFLCFQNMYVSGDCRADCDGSGALEPSDFLCFQQDFAAGCEALSLTTIGVEPPPRVLCSRVMIPFPRDARLRELVTGVKTPLGGAITFDAPMEVRHVDWGHGYESSIYSIELAPAIRIGIPANRALYLYVQPTSFETIEIEITARAGGQLLRTTDVIDGRAGAWGYSFCGGVERIDVRSTDGASRFAVGEFGIAR